jgi:hypothetical protein
VAAQLVDGVEHGDARPGHPEAVLAKEVLARPAHTWKSRRGRGRPCVTLVAL